MVVRRGVTLVLVGDVFVCQRDPSSMFSSVAPELQRADITFGNLEAPVADRGEPIIGKAIAGFNLHSPPEVAVALRAAGFDVMGLASNHSMDYGAEAILQTIDLLDSAGIAHCGAGRDIEEARRPAVVERNGCRVAFLSRSSVFEPRFFPAGPGRTGIATVRVYTYQPPPRAFEQPGTPAIIVTWPDPADLEQLLHDVRAAKDVADVVVLSWHWGISQAHGKPTSYQMELGRKAIEAGADLIIGHHPHALQGIEIYREGIICYSLGNFAFDMEGTGFAPESLILKCEIGEGRIQRCSILPVLLDATGRPELVTAAQARQVVGVIERASAEFGSKITLAGDEIVIAAPARIRA